MLVEQEQKAIKPGMTVALPPTLVGRSPFTRAKGIVLSVKKGLCKVQITNNRFVDICNQICNQQGEVVNFLTVRLLPWKSSHN